MIKELFGTDPGFESVFLAKLTKSGLGGTCRFPYLLSGQSLTDPRQHKRLPQKHKIGLFFMDNSIDVDKKDNNTRRKAPRELSGEDYLLIFDVMNKEIRRRLLSDS
nr:hypothetical protein [uncultured Cohaesibacter sp.]